MTTTDLQEVMRPALPSLLAGELAEYYLQAVGPSDCALVGSALQHLLPPLRAAGCAVAHRDMVLAFERPERGVIAWGETPEQRQQALALDAAVLMLVAPGELLNEAALWVGEAAASGWQRHTAQFALRSVSQELCVLLLARVGVDQESDQTLLRACYHGLASALVRPGDRVLAADAADHNLWRILHQQARCGWLGVVTDQPEPSDLEPDVAWLPSATWQPPAAEADVVVTRLGHDGSYWAQELHDVQTALVRSGRLVIAVPLEDGRHIGERALMQALTQHGLEIDRAWWQSLSRPVGVNQFLEVLRDDSGQLLIDPDSKAVADALVLLAVKTTGPGVTRRSDCQLPNIIAFQRDYVDASVVRLIVADGLRIHSSPLRRQLARQILADAPSGSADHGAALCVLLYDPVAVQSDDRRPLLDAAARYIEVPADNPTVLRWQVSLTYAAASVHHAAGELEQAAALYQRVLGFDVLAFSPLLGTKTTAAATRLGWIRFGHGDLVGARNVWAHGLDEARRLSAQPDWSAVIGDPQAPETFAMPEFAAVMDEAACLAAALRLTAETPLRPGLAWQWATRSWRAQLMELRTEQQRRQKWQEHLQDAKDWLDGQYHNLTSELDRVTEENNRCSQDLAGAKAAFRLASRRATVEKMELLNRIEKLEGEVRQLDLAYGRVVDAARRLTNAGQFFVSINHQAPLPGDVAAEEMNRLATALDQVPCRRIVRMSMRMLSYVFGRRSVK